MKTTLLFSIALFFACTISAQNLVNNPGFETAVTGMPTGDIIPTYPTELDSWTAVTVDGELVNAPEYAFSGNGLMSVLQNAGAHLGAYWENSSTNTGFDRAGQLIEVEPNTEYVYSFYYRGGTGVRYGYIGGDLLFQIEETSPSYMGMVSEIIDASDTTTWNLHTGTFTSGPSTTEIIILFSPIGVASLDVWIDDVEFREPFIVGVEENSLENLTLYPNPTSETFSLNLPSESQSLIRIYSDLGTLVKESYLSGKASIDVSDLSAGIYFIHVENGQNKGVRKLMVQ